MRFTTLFLVLVLAATIGVATCTSDAFSTTAAPAPVPLPETLPPIRYVIGCDKTKSAPSARIPAVAPDAFDPLLARLRQSGGEIGFGIISDDSDQPLVRVAISAEPNIPIAQPVVGNAFKAAEAKHKADADRARLSGIVAAWKRDADAKLVRFKRDISPLVSRAADAPATDIQSFTARADLMLSEPSRFGRHAACVLILITDGKETVSSSPIPPLSGNVTVILVNGAGSVAALSPLKPLRFESIDAAIQYAAGIGGRDAR